MLLDLFRFLTGYLRVEVTGGQPERFVNLAVSDGVDLWNLKHPPGTVVTNLPLTDFFRLRPLARRAGCRLHIRERHGAPFIWSRLSQRRGWWGGAVLSLGLLFWVSQHVWVIEIRGTQYLDPHAVEYAARQLGLHRGVPKWRIEPASLERRLPYVAPELSWATVRLQGIRAVIEVVERQTVQKLNRGQRMDVVADKECIVAEIIPFRGRARARPGEPVRAGQLLIEGVVWVHSTPPMVMPGQPRPEPDRPLRVTAASGQVRGRCFYEDYLEQPLLEGHPEPTGRLVRSVVLRWHDTDILRAGSQQRRFIESQEVRRKWRLPGWRNWVLPVELEIITVREIRVERTAVPISVAESRAAQSLLERVNWHLNPASDRVLRLTATLVQRQSDLAGFRVWVETLEEIGRTVLSDEGLPVPIGHTESIGG